MACSRGPNIRRIGFLCVVTTSPAARGEEKQAREGRNELRAEARQKPKADRTAVQKSHSFGDIIRFKVGQNNRIKAGKRL